MTDIFNLLLSGLKVGENLFVFLQKICLNVKSLLFKTNLPIVIKELFWSIAYQSFQY